MAVAASFVALTMLAFDGSGSGKAVTPYTKSFEATAAHVQSLREASRTTRMFEGVKTAQSGAPSSGVALAFAIAHEGKWDKVLDDLGGVDVAEIESVALVESRGNKLVLELKQFPTISAAELVAKKPTYTELRNGYGKTTRVEVDRDLALLDREWYGEPLRLLCLARDLRPNEPVRLLAERTRYQQNQTGPWWAIPSVTADPAYPHKLVTKK